MLFQPPELQEGIEANLNGGSAVSDQILLTRGFIGCVCFLLFIRLDAKQSLGIL
jgi:hypothetical protein